MRSRQENSSKTEGAVCIQQVPERKNPQLPGLETENYINFLIVNFLLKRNIDLN